MSQPYDYVQAPRRELLDQLLRCTPGAKEQFDEGFVYEAFELIREATRSGRLRVKADIDVDVFLFDTLQGMPSNFGYAAF